MNPAKSKSLLKLAFSGMCLTLCLLFPFLTANSRELGNILCLMHIPVLLCGFACGPIYGGIVGFVAPLVRSFLFGMPPFPVVAVPMAFELTAYGIITGLLYHFLPKKIVFVYPNLILSMAFGRIVSVIAKYIMYALDKTEFSLSTVMKLNFVTTLPGVVLQLLLIPAVVYALRKQRVFSNES